MTTPPASLEARITMPLSGPESTRATPSPVFQHGPEGSPTTHNSSSTSSGGGGTPGSPLATARVSKGWLGGSSVFS